MKAWFAVLLLLVVSLPSAAQTRNNDASPVCWMMFYVEAFEYRQECGPAIDDDRRIRYHLAMHILDQYMRRHGIVGAAESYTAVMRQQRRSISDYCQRKESSQLARLFDDLTNPMFVEEMEARLALARDPSDGGCL